MSGEAEREEAGNCSAPLYLWVQPWVLTCPAQTPGSTATPRADTQSPNRSRREENCMKQERRRGRGDTTSHVGGSEQSGWHLKATHDPSTSTKVLRGLQLVLEGEKKSWDQTLRTPCPGGPVLVHSTAVLFLTIKPGSPTKDAGWNNDRV